jgi:hypothetical protein
VPKPAKWRQNRDSVKKGDIVVFLKTGQKAVLGDTPWRTGRIRERVISKDGKCREVEIEYIHGDETFYRTTRRSTRTVAVVSPESEVEVFQRLNDSAQQSAMHMAARTSTYEVPEDEIFLNYWAFLIHPKGTMP